jgi:exopolysaccharide/PEP-CTERM locus tyrosine autokinase
VSLVERAISRLRQSQSDAAPPVPDAPVPDVAALAAAKRLHARRNASGALIAALNDTARSPKRLTIDVAELRASGYLPDQREETKFANDYRQIKTALLETAMPDRSSAILQGRIIMITSALPGDGKTFTSINLALSMAQNRDVSVLLVDADVPKPHVSEIFHLQLEPGLTDALQDATLDVESLVVPTSVAGLSVLPAGSPVDGAAELLSSNRMRELLASLLDEDANRVLLLDSPPLLITSEGRALIRCAGQVVMVVRAGKTPVMAVEQAIALVDDRQAGGIVLNDERFGLLAKL